MPSANAKIRSEPSIAFRAKRGVALRAGADILNVRHSAMETAKLGKRGTLVIPAKLRLRFASKNAKTS
jgi:hypothetical protein